MNEQTKNKGLQFFKPIMGKHEIQFISEFPPLPIHQYSPIKGRAFAGLIQCASRKKCPICKALHPSLLTKIKRWCRNWGQKYCLTKQKGGNI